MMSLNDIAMLTFSCVSANHLGLIGAIEGVIHRSLPILNCPRCLTFWSVLLYTMVTDRNIVRALAISFLCAYMAIWIELLMCFIDTKFNKLYEKIYSESDDSQTSAAEDNDSSDRSVSDLSENK